MATIILNGDDLSIPEDILSAHIRYARRGHRLAVLDFSDDLARRHFAHGDAHIDLWLGHYGFFSDHEWETDYRSAIDEMFGYRLDTTITDPAKEVLRDLFSQQGRYGSLAGLKEAVGALSQDQVRKSLTRVPSDDAKAARLTWSITSFLRELIGQVHDQNPQTRLMSVSKWMDLEPSSILFVSHYRQSDPIGRALSGRLRRPSMWYNGGAELVFYPDRSDADDPYESQLELALKSDRERLLTIDFDNDFVSIVSNGPGMAEAVEHQSPSNVAKLSPVALERAPEPVICREDAVDTPAIPMDETRHVRAGPSKLVIWAGAAIAGLLGTATILDEGGSATEKRHEVGWAALSDSGLGTTNQAEQRRELDWMALADNRLDAGNTSKEGNDDVR